MLWFVVIKSALENPKKFFIWCGVIFGGLLALGLYLTWDKQKALAERKAVDAGGKEKTHLFNGDVKAYLKTPEKRAPKDAARALKGKVLTVDYNAKAVDHLYDDLPDDLRAASAEEVGTVVWLFWGTEKVADDRSKGGVMVTVCEVVVIDVAASEIIGQRRIRGEHPAQGGVAGPKPTKEVLAYLDQLRGKAPAAP